MKFSSIFVVLAAIYISNGCSSGPRKFVDVAPNDMAHTTAVLEPYHWGSIQRLHTFDDIYLASQPTPEDFEEARKDGVRTVLNIRYADEITGFDEARVIADLGLNYISLPWNGPDELTDAIFDRTREILNNAERPILFHCGSANRVGAVWFPWRVLDGGVSITEALKEAKIIGLRSPALEAKAKAFINRRQN